MVVFVKIFNEKWSLLNLDEQQDCSGLDIKRQICKTKRIPSTDIFYLTCNGSILENDSKIKSDSFVHCHVRVPGGKGGFGSMLRAIGAQIEKTTNREACRDLSGRRMRDVNDEKKIADWLSKKEERDAEKARRKQERLERLQTTPKHVFEDSTSYTSQLQENMDSIGDALQKGLKSTNGSTSSTLGKRKSSEKKKSHSKKRRLWLGIDEDLSSDSEEDSDTLSSCSSVADSDFSENSSKASSSASATSSLMLTNTSKTTSSVGNPSSSSKSDEFKEAIVDDNCEAPKTSTTKQKNRSNDKKYEHIVESEQQQTTGIKDNASSPCSNVDSSKNQESTLQHTTAKSEDVICSSNLASRKPSSGIEEKDNPTEKAEISTGKAEQLVQTTTSSVNLPLDLDQFNSIAELESLGLDVLKSALISLGLKCGGTLQQRAERLFSIKGIPHEKIDPSLFAKSGKSKEKKR